MGKYNLDFDIFGNTKPKLLLREVVPSTNDRIYDLSVDFAEYNSSPVSTPMVFIKGDRNTSIINAKLLMNKTPVDLNDVVITINLKEGVYETYTILCDDVNVEASTVTVSLPIYTVDETGENVLEFVITKGEKILTSQMYKYTINNSLGEGYIGDEEEESTLHQLIQKTQTLKNELEVDVTQEDINDIIGMIRTE